MRHIIKIHSNDGERKHNSFVVSFRIFEKLLALQNAGGFLRFHVDLQDVSDRAPLSKRANIARFLAEIMGEKTNNIIKFL